MRKTIGKIIVYTFIIGVGVITIYNCITDFYYFLGLMFGLGIIALFILGLWMAYGD